MNEKPVKLPRVKTCKGCGVKFQPVRTLQIACSVECAYKVARVNGGKARAVKYRADKKKLKTRSDWLKEAQQSFNLFIRTRDGIKGYGCISCGTHNGKANCGHYRSVGASPELRFEESQTALQCERCNTYLSGNLIEYRKGLLARVGQEKLDWIEGHHEPKKYTVDDLKEIKEKYRIKTKELIASDG